MSIRLRLTLTYSTILVVILIIFSITVLSVLHWALLETVDKTLSEAVNEVNNSIRGPFVGVSEQGRFYPAFSIPNELNVLRASDVYVQVWSVDGDLTSRSNNLGTYAMPLDEDALHAQQQTLRNVTINGIPLRVLTRPIITDTAKIIGLIQVGASIGIVQDAEQWVGTVMLIVGVFALVTSLFFGTALIERALQPIETIAEAASKIATGDDLSSRIPYDGPPDELGRLTMVFNATLGRLENLFVAQRRFVADVSHELRTPLTVIQTNTDLMKRYGMDEDSLVAISSESKRMTRLVGDLLLLAQADSGELPLITQNLELDTLVLEVFEQSRILSEGGASVVLGRFEPVRVHADPDRLKQLLLNLTSNALKYTPSEGSVTLSVWPDGPEAMISVADTGEGIPSEDLPHIFDRFYRVDKARARKHGGAGLGLSIAHWIVEAHGGHIAVQSVVGAGTTFTIRLPRQIPPPESVVETIHNMRLPARMRARNGNR
jgi:two-component system OmpR family sensor kinase